MFKNLELSRDLKLGSVRCDSVDGGHDSLLDHFSVDEPVQYGCNWMT